MSKEDTEGSSERPALPRDAFRGQRASGISGHTSTMADTPIAPAPQVVMPDYPESAAINLPDHKPTEAVAVAVFIAKESRPDNSIQPVAYSARNPFEAYGERSTSRPYAMRLPDAIDLVLRQIAAEQRTHPLRIIDRILHDHLQRIGRLPQAD